MDTLFDRNGRLCGQELDRRAALCEDCMSETCSLNPEGICLFPMLFGREPVVTEIGCLDWILNEKEMDD